MCLQLFVDDTNALVANKEASLKLIWNCLQIFCSASGSKINHNKTGVKTHGRSIPEWMLQQGWQPIIEGEVFRLLGIPMAFKITLQQRWNWVISKLAGKLNRWENTSLSFAGRILAINHYITPVTLFFLACWRPPDQALKAINQTCSTFLWSGAAMGKKIPKVQWSLCILAKEKGGLGIHDITEMADRLASKWILRGFLAPEQDWAMLIARNRHKFKLQGRAKWSNLPPLTILFSPFKITAMGSHLVQSLWKAWNHLKDKLCPNPRQYRDAGLRFKDSIWWPWIEIPRIEDANLHQALKLHKKGIRCWGDIWNKLNQAWLTQPELSQKYMLNPTDLQLILSRMECWKRDSLWKIGGGNHHSS